MSHHSPETKTDLTINGVVVGTVADVSSNGCTVRFGGGAAVPAVALAALPLIAKGDAVALMFQDGNPQRPVILGKMETKQVDLAAGSRITQSDEQIEIAHDKCIVLRCGKAVLTMRGDGRIELNGEYLLSTARGMNRIAGASVKIN